MVPKLATELSEDEQNYYSRQIVLDYIGYSGQLKLRNAKVCIVGLGGLGSPAAIQLATMGVGHLRLVDRDVVDISNLQRQHLYSTKDIGYPKVEAAARRLQAINPYINLELIPATVHTHNAHELVKGMDVLVDGLDSITPRYAINRACYDQKIPYVFAGAIMTYGSISTIIPDQTACLECFQGNLEQAQLPTCGVVGVHPAILGVVSSLEVSETVNLIIGKPPQLAGKLLFSDIAEVEFEKIDLTKAQSCPVCGKTPTKPAQAQKTIIYEEICGREGKRVHVMSPYPALNLDLDKLKQIIKSRGYKIAVSANYGLNFTVSPQKHSSILKSGIMIHEGAQTQEDAQEFYHQILAELDITLN